MGTTAQKLEYLGTTKSQLKDMINYGLDDNNKITNSTTFRNYVSSIFNAFLEALKTPDTLFTNLPKKSGSGAVISLNDTANAPMRIELGSRELEQETTTGKNLLNINSSITIPTLYTAFDSNISIPAGTYVLNCSKITTSGSYNSRIMFRDSSGEVLSAYLSSSTLSTNITLSRAIDRVWVYSQDNYDHSVGISTTIENLMVSTSGGTYEPYTGGIASPNPSYPQDIHTISGSNTIKVEGSNIFNWNNPRTITLVKSVNRTTSEYPVSSLVLEPGTYTISIPDLVMTNNNSNLGIEIVGIASGTTLINKARTFTITEEKTLTYLYIYLNSSDNSNATATFSQIQLELGSTATTYTPYVSQEADIDLKSRNLLDVSYYQQGSIDGSTGQDAVNSQNARGENYIPVKPNTTYTICANKVLDSLRLSQYASDKSHIRRDERKTSGLTITTTANTYFVRWSLNYDQSASTTKELIEGLDLMLVEGDTIPDYEPYYDINYSKIGNYEDKFIRNSGKNLIDMSKATDGKYIKSSDGSLGTYASGFATDYIEVEEGKAYYFSNMKSLNSGNTGAMYNANKEFVSGITSDSDIRPLTIPSGVKYIRLSIWKNNYADTTNPKPMLAQSSTEISYEPYGSNEWYYKQAIGKVVLDGTEDWLKQWEQSTPNMFIVMNLLSDSLRFSSATTNIICKSTHFVPVSYDSGDYSMWKLRANDDYPYLITITDNASSSAVGSLLIKDTQFTTLNDFKTWLASNNVLVYYILNTPTYTKITGTLAEQLENVYQKMLSYSGQTNISQVNNDLSFVINASALEDIS